MLKRMLLLAACAAVALGGTPALAGGNVNFTLGNRTLNQDNYGPLDEQPFIGGYAEFPVMAWPVDLSAGVYRSTKDDTVSGFDVSATITEVSFGAMKTWNVMGNMYPFAGGGLSMVKVSAEVDTGSGTASADDTSGAYYAEGGVYWRMGEVFNLGVHGRFNRGSKINLEGANFNSDYFQVGVLAGFGFGK